MKNKLKNLSLLLFIIFSILIVSCEAESYVVEKKPDSVNLQDLKFRVIPFDQVGSKFNQISQELELNKHIIGLVKNNGMQQREATVNNGIEIVDGLVKELTYDEYTSYTMLIKSEEATNKFYNLVIEKIGQLTKLAVVKYEPTEEWMLTKGEFKGEITTFRINDLQTTIGRLDELILGNGSSGGNTTYPTDCNGYVVSTTVVTETLCGCNDHSWQQLVNGTCTCDDTPSLQTTTYYECIEFGTPNGPGTGNSSSPGGYVTGYPIGSTPTNSQNNVSTLTMPFSKDEIIKMFYYELSSEQQQWWKDENNSNSRAEIEAYIVNQPNVEIAKNFGNWVITYFMNNPSVSWEKFKNWFMGKSEGNDGEFNSEYWDNPNLTFPQQSLPSFSDFKNACPSKTTTAQVLCNEIGGEVITMHDAVVASGRKLNTCAIRISKALNGSGVIIPEIPDNPNGTKNTVKGSDGKNYIINAKTLNAWMKKTFGTNPQNYHHITSNQGGLNGANFPNLINGMQGIYTMVALPSIQTTWGSGHADLLENGECRLNCHFYDEANQFVPVYYIDVWILN